jgi:hypothetical protein
MTLLSLASNLAAKGLNASLICSTLNALSTISCLFASIITGTPSVDDEDITFSSQLLDTK